LYILMGDFPFIPLVLAGLFSTQTGIIEIHKSLEYNTALWDIRHAWISVTCSVSLVHWRARVLVPLCILTGVHPRYVELPRAMPAGLVSNTPSCCELKRKAVFVYKLTFHSGDSYTTPGFNDTGVQPSIGNPLGNPNYPGYTSSNGPNWVDFLTVKYNESQVLTCNPCIRRCNFRFSPRRS
jgi:hypothetical protein